MFVFFAWVIWFWILITVFSDLFRRRDMSGGSKVLWIIFVILLPFLGVFVYIIANHDGMAERNIERAQARQESQMDTVREIRRRKRRCRGRDRESEGAPRLGRDEPSRVRRHQGEGTRSFLASA